jgi:murein DD-endopeptidase MepM/ murein hydrolase activator NlpD
MLNQPPVFIQKDYKQPEARLSRHTVRWLVWTLILIILFVIGYSVKHLLKQDASSALGENVVIGAQYPAETIPAVSFPLTTPKTTQPLTTPITSSKTRSPVTSSSLPFPGPIQRPWTDVAIRDGDNLSRLFAKLGISPTELDAIMSLGSVSETLKALHPGEQIRLQLSPSKEVLNLAYSHDPTMDLVITRKQAGFQANTVHHPVEVHHAFAAATIKDSLFTSGQKAGVDDRLMMQLISIFNWDIDFALNIHPTDHFKIIYEERYVDGKKIANGAILAAEFVNQGKVYQAVRFVDKAGHTNYYTPTGMSLHKAFLRTPVKFTRISSTFSLARQHPILHHIRAHHGVDYAAPEGTPVKATGNGLILFIGQRGGYGNMIVIQHSFKYSTVYGHLSRFTKGLHMGSPIKQGQIIAYVGHTGLATGPHLHYEFRINGIYQNPLTVQLPKALPLPAMAQAEFDSKTRPLIAELAALSPIQLALKDTAYGNA